MAAGRAYRSAHAAVKPRPGGVLFRGFDACLDEGDALDPVLDGGVEDILWLRALAARRADGSCSFGIDVRKALEIALRMTGWHAGDARRGRSRARSGAGQQLLRLAERRVPEVVGVGLHP